VTINKEQKEENVGARWGV